MLEFNLGNVTGLLRGTIPPEKPYVLWGKILVPETPDIVEIRYYKGTGLVSDEANWIPVSLALQKVTKIIPSGSTTYNLPSSEWSTVGDTPNFQLIDTATGRVVGITPTYAGMSSPDYIPTSMQFNFGGPIPNDFKLVLS